MKNIFSFALLVCIAAPSFAMAQSLTGNGYYVPPVANSPTPPAQTADSLQFSCADLVAMVNQYVIVSVHEGNGMADIVADNTKDCPSTPRWSQKAVFATTDKDNCNIGVVCGYDK